MDVTTRNINFAKKEVIRLKALKKKFKNDPFAQGDIKELITKHLKFITRGQEELEQEKIRPLS